MSSIRWKRISIPIGIAAIATLGSILISGPHPYRVVLARGRWCTLAQPQGSAKLLYGQECDRLPPGQAVQFLWDKPQDSLTTSPGGDRI